ncbi:MAG TPA: response regulator [Polyangiaceae bacterium]|nr:response regulator [Polyangiaceae bacterium]
MRPEPRIIAARLAVLLVDDDEAYRFSLAVLLEDEIGVEVDVASTYDEATQKLEEAGNKYALVLLDQMLGSHPGQTLVPLVRERAPAARIMVVSGAEPSRAVEEAVDGVVLKTLAIPRLLEAISRQLEVRESATIALQNPTPGGPTR